MSNNYDVGKFVNQIIPNNMTTVPSTLTDNYLNQVRAVMGYRQNVADPTIFVQQNIFLNGEDVLNSNVTNTGNLPDLDNSNNSDTGDNMTKSNCCTKPKCDTYGFSYLDSDGTSFKFLLTNSIGFENDFLKVDVEDDVSFIFKKDNLKFAKIARIEV